MSRRIDLTGRVFGRLTVTKYLGKFRYECICTCGNVKQINVTSLRSGSTRSCGCIRREQLRALRFQDLTGQRFGRLIVLAQADHVHGRTAWLCRCDCSTKTFVRTAHELKSGDTRSCGCLRKEIATAQAVRIGHEQVGPKSPAWNPNLSDEDRQRKRRGGVVPARRYLVWRTKVFKRCGRRCAICQSTTNRLFRAHHIYSWAAYPKKRFTVSNGEIFCEECHKAYHKLAGHRAPTTRKHFNTVIRALRLVSLILLIATVATQRNKNDNKRQTNAGS